MDIYTPDHVWAEVRNRLMADPYNLKERGGHLREGICPSCGKKTLWTKHANQPGRVWCDRENNCGYSATAKELFPDLFDFRRVVRDNPATPENPNATADAWMREIRGFDLAQVKGWYKQESYQYRPDEAKEAGLPGEPVVAVRFLLPAPMQGGWDRFLDGEHFGKKTYLHNGTKLNGWMWTPPGQRLQAGDRLFVTEGIFDALALMHTGGRKVAALMGATNKPADFVREHAHLHLHYVAALDNDNAGRSNTLKLIRWFREQQEKASAIQPTAEQGKKLDWNDLLLTGKLADKDFEDYHYFGDLLTAPTAVRKAMLLFKRNGDNFAVFEHQRSTYTWELDMKEYDKAVGEIRIQDKLEEGEELSDEQRERALLTGGAVQLLANCGMDFLYTQRNPISDELYYFFRIRHADRRETLNTLTGTQLATAADFRKRLLSMAPGALIRADADAHSYLLTRWMNAIRDVDVIGYAGYSARHQAWVFPDFAVHKGKVVAKNSEDYVELDHKARVKSAYHSVEIHANADLRDYQDEWLFDLYAAWGTRGIIALAFWTASLFAQQIRELNKSFTFLELVGDPGTGKTTLIEFLWRLFGRSEFEGFDPSSSNPAFVARALNQVANLPAVMIEGDRETRKAGHRGQFNWAETKKLYNGRSMKGRGMRTQGNETYEPPFLGSLCISQNAPVDAEQAVLERIVHVYFHKHDTSASTLAAVKRLTAMGMDQVSGYLVKCLTAADKLLETYRTQQALYEEIYRNNPGQKTYRLALNHSQMAAALHMLKHVTPMTDSMLAACLKEVQAMSLAREKAIATEHPDVEQFFEVMEYLEQHGVRINHSADGGEVAINLAEVYDHAAKYNQQLQNQTLIKPLLRACRRYKDCKLYHSRLKQSSVRCWFFSEQARA